MEARFFPFFNMKIAGTLFWTSDKYGNTWVLLARRRKDSALGRIYTYTIPCVDVGNGEDVLSAAARAGHDELGLMTDKAEMQRFWNVETDNIVMSLYSQRLASMKMPKCKGMYFDALWFCLPDDCHIEDADSLLASELEAFASSLSKDSRAVV